MISIWLLVWISAATIVNAPQNRVRVGDFTASPTEHIIVQLQEPFVVHSVRGTINRKEGFREPLKAVLFEIQGPDSNKEIRRAVTNQDGYFKIGRTPPGKYRFKATLDGFQSVMGTILVSRDAKAGVIKIEMPVGV